MAHPTPRALTIAALLLLLAGCGGGHGERWESATKPETRTEVEVENLQWDDLTIYLVHNGRYVRLGWVVAQTSEVLTIPDAQAHSPDAMFLVAAHPSDREAHAFSTEFLVEPGQRHRWVILPSAGPSQVIY